MYVVERCEPFDSNPKESNPIISKYKIVKRNQIVRISPIACII